MLFHDSDEPSLKFLRPVLLPASTKLGQGNIFTSVCQEFCPRGVGWGGGWGWGEGVCLSACWDTPPRSRHPPGAETPPGSRPPGSRHPPGADTPRSRHPPRADTPPRADPPGADTPSEANCSIRSMSGRYASYWNAFLF